MSFELPQSTLSTHNSTTITVRDKELSSEIMGNIGFVRSWYYLLHGEEPTAGEQQLLDAMCCSLMVHGTTPHAIVSRLAYLSEPTSMQGAVASGLLGVGSRFAGAMQACATDLQAIVDDPHMDKACEALVAKYQEQNVPFPGIGHPHLDPVDPRAERLFELAREYDLDGEHVLALQQVQVIFETHTGANLPINVTGAIAALASDMGFPPEGARGIAVLSRTAGLIAEVLDEQTAPIAGDIYAEIDARRSNNTP